MGDIAQLAFIIFLIGCSAFFSGSETAFFSIPHSKSKTFADSEEKRKNLVADLLKHPRDLLVTVFLMNTVVNILLQNTASGMFGQYASWGLKVGVPLILTLIFGEIIPKYIGMVNNVSVALKTAPTIYWIQNVLAPVRRWIIAVTAPVTRTLFFFLRDEESIAKEELRHVLKTSEKDGVLLTEEADLVWGYLNLQESSVREIMWPREDILAYDIEEPLSKLIHLFVDMECTRVPVYKENLDEMLGIAHANDFFLERDNIKNQDDLCRILTKPIYVPENSGAQTLLHKFKETCEFVALVVDQYGVISGIISQEDVLEMVIGDILDIRDQGSLFSRSGKNEIIASGKLDLMEFNNIFQTSLTSEYNMVTLGGWLTEKLGIIPNIGTKYETEEFVFQILAADPNRIQKVYVRKIKGKKGGSAQEAAE